jgi:hypothetical protein
MPESPFYTNRFLAKSRRETSRFIKHRLLTGAAVAISAVIVRLALWRFHHVTLSWAEVWITLLTIVGSYGIVIAGAFIVNLFRAPALLDQERADEIAALTKENEALKHNQAGPEVSSQELRRREIVSAEAAKLDDIDRKILRYIHDHGQIHARILDQQFGDMALQSFVAKATRAGLISYANHLINIKPELNAAIESVFCPD